MADVEIQITGETMQVTLSGRLDADSVGRYWSSTFQTLRQSGASSVRIDAAALKHLDGAGVVFLRGLQRRVQSPGRFEIQNLKPDFQKLLEDSVIPDSDAPPVQETSFRRVAEDLGLAGYSVLDDLRVQVSFLGELAYRLFFALLHPHKIRWKAYLLLVEKAGADAINITGLLGFLIGLILAFQSAIGMAQFGAEVYIADMIVLSMFKEMGPLITAFVVASRSGSAYAAEIGTMKVNEELDALHTFGMDPVRFLVVPRVMALVTTLPLLSLFNIVFGLFGAQLVMLLLGFPPIVFWDRCRDAAGLMDLFSGLAKTLVFGYFIAAIGCLRGLNTGKGASAVGDAATRAVVTCIVMIVVVDGIFAVIYYSLGI